jgi:ribosomal protein S18 acetylase RimI-like enzyme
MIPQPITMERQRGLCLPHGLLFGHDAAVAAWTWNEFRHRVMPVDAAIGIVRSRQLVGSAIFQNFSGYNVELSYYGPQTFSAGIAKSLARYALERFIGIDRLTMRTNRKNTSILKMFHRFGFKYEGTQVRYYGPFGDAAVFMLFREDLERIGGLATGKDDAK